MPRHNHFERDGGKVAAELRVWQSQYSFPHRSWELSSELYNVQINQIQVLACKWMEPRWQTNKSVRQQ